MRRHLVVLAVLAATAAPAHADPTPVGLPCGFTSATVSVDDTITTQAGEIHGGPIVAEPERPSLVTLTCTLQVGATTHDGPNTFFAAASGAVVIAVPPTAFVNRIPLGATVAICTEVAVTHGDGTTLRYYLDGETGEYTTNPAAQCVVPFD